MDKEKVAFAARLRGALEAKGIEASPVVVEKRFNSRYEGAAVTQQAISGWLNGKSIPKQDKLRVLAVLVGMEPHELQYGGTSRVSEGKLNWADGLGVQDRMMVDAFLALPSVQRKLVRDLIAMLASSVDARD